MILAFFRLIFSFLCVHIDNPTIVHGGCGRATKHLRTRLKFAGRYISLSAYERDLVTDKKVEFQNLDPNRTLEKFFFFPRVPSIGIREL